MGGQRRVQTGMFRLRPNGSCNLAEVVSYAALRAKRLGRPLAAELSVQTTLLVGNASPRGDTNMDSCALSSSGVPATGADRQFERVVAALC